VYQIGKTENRHTIRVYDMMVVNHINNKYIEIKDLLPRVKTVYTYTFSFYNILKSKILWFCGYRITQIVIKRPMNKMY